MRLLSEVTLALALGLWVSAAGAVGFMIEYEKGYEVDELDVITTATRFGEVRVRECDDCEPIRLRLTEDTELFVGGEPVPLANLRLLRGRAGVVFRDIENENVLRIKVYGDE